MSHWCPALSGSTRSQSPPSARRISSGFRRGASSPGRTRKRSSVSARTTFISVMANVCPMQFLWVGAGALTAPGTLIWAPQHPAHSLHAQWWRRKLTTSANHPRVGLHIPRPLPTRQSCTQTRTQGNRPLSALWTPPCTPNHSLGPCHYVWGRGGKQP